VQAHSIVRATIGETARRHATALSVLVLLLTLAGCAAYLVLYRTVEPTGTLRSADLLYAACQVLPYGLVGAVLVAMRPDLPFGWLLSLAAMALVLALVVMGPSVWAIETGHGGQLAVWGLNFGALAFVPVALEGLVNVRFPSGRPSIPWGRRLDRVLVWGIVLSLVGAVLGDSTIRAVYPDGAPDGAERFIDGTPLVEVGNAFTIGVPLVILLGVLAGLGVVVRCVRAEGLERKQLEWRAAGVLVALALFPFAVTETLPDWVSDVAPLLFVVTLAVPVLRYELWAIDTLIRRSAAYTMTSSGTVVENMLRAVAEMLRLPYVAVRRVDGVLASYGAATDDVESWPLVDQEEPVGVLVAAPRRGLASLDERDRQVLATLARLVAGSVRSEALTADLLDARQQLVTAREEERRRLRRDLHDGLGPLLTGLGLNLDAAQSTLARDADRAATYVGNAKDASTQVIAGLRDLVYGLRPPALDDLGFEGAVRLQAERIARDAGLALELRVPAGLALPAAVEVAAFRTVVEAVTNVVKHGRATRILVEVEPGADCLVVTVGDDGTSGDAWQPGVGLTSMRERAEELGGTFHAGPGPDGGRVRIAFPLG
jgi:signal transduction histidine kinase